jgi:hypothetical protein
MFRISGIKNKKESTSNKKDRLVYAIFDPQTAKH